MVLHPNYHPSLGATCLDDRRCRFLVWAPRARTVEVRLPGPPERLLPMQPRERGYFELLADDVPPGTRYFYRIDGQRDRPDPASRFQPEGIHQASAVVDPQFAWTDQHWRGIPLHQYITYELHVGTFTAEGTFDAAVAQLDDLVELGVTAIELMPVAQFPGSRNWGYDGVNLFAVQNSYGGPQGLKRLVDAAHACGLAVVLDVVYNHVGPEGNYLSEFGHYFTDRHHTPWGPAVNFDDRDSDEVRRLFIENALYWIGEFHVDALRLDAVHAIFDQTARPFLQELADAVRLEGERLNRRVYTIAESSLGDARLIAPKQQGGYGIDAQWCDDLHHAVHTELLDERSGYYADFQGFPDVVKSYRDGWVLDGGYSAYRGRRHGNSARHVEPARLVVYAQNHDQVANRLLGERLSELVGFEELKLAAALVLLSPYQPLLFMGEEYAETARFQFFISHLDADLAKAVWHGRKEEFARFRWQHDPPDPQDEAAFVGSKLNHHLKREGRHRVLRTFYQRLIALRKTEPPLAFPDRDRLEVHHLDAARTMAVHAMSRTSELFTVFHFGRQPAGVEVAMPQGRWHKLLDSSDPQWNGPGTASPEEVQSPGRIEVPMAPRTVVMYRSKDRSAQSYPR